MWNVPGPAPEHRFGWRNRVEPRSALEKIVAWTSSERSSRPAISSSAMPRRSRVAARSAVRLRGRLSRATLRKKSSTPVSRLLRASVQIAGRDIDHEVDQGVCGQHCFPVEKLVNRYRDSG